MSQRIETLSDKQYADILLKVREAQVQQLYRQTWLGLTGGFVITLALSFSLWSVLPHGRLLLWVGLFTLITLARARLAAAFQKKAPDGRDIYRWARWHVFGVVVSGAMWAYPALFLWPADSPVHQMAWPVCIVAISAAGVAMYCTWTPSYVTLLLMAVLPISFRLLSEGGVAYMTVGFLGLFFIGILLRTGMEMHAASLHALEMGIRNEALSSFLAEEKAKQEELTQKLQKAHDQLHRLSLTDDLTGLYNRRYFHATIPEDVAQVFRHYRDLRDGLFNASTINIDMLFIMVDMDHFKKVNDSYGHAAGDRVLVQMRELLIKTCREADTVVRWGGEEFLVVARDICRSNFDFLLERIRLAVENHPFDIGLEQPYHLTCSLGAAVFPFHVHWPEKLPWEKVVELADHCLYAAKRSARNAWVGLVSTEQAKNDDLTGNLSQELADFICQGKLKVSTSLPDCSLIRWDD